MRGRIVLASASPRRKALLEAACFEVDVRISNADESWPKGPVTEAAVKVAKRKLAAVTVSRDELVVAADTVVTKNGEVLGKPKDAAAALRTLQSLAGATHEVVTGFCVSRAGVQIVGSVVTHVGFRALEDAELERYIATGEPFDKAGAYGIQGAGGGLVAWVKGSYTNIVGLPLLEVLAAVSALP